MASRREGVGGWRRWKKVEEGDRGGEADARLCKSGETSRDGIEQKKRKVYRDRREQGL